MSAPGQLVRRLRIERRLARRAVAKLTGLTPRRQRELERGSAAPSFAERRAYARAFGFDSVQAFDERWRGAIISVSRGELQGRIPVINFAPAGPPRDFGEPYIDSGIGHAYIDPPPGVFGPNLFAFVIDGDSMEPDFPQGSYAICRPAPPEAIDDGQPVLVRFGESRNDECTFKRCYRRGGGEVELRPINPAHASLVVAAEEIVRMAPVIAVVAPSQAHRRLPGEAYHLLADDVQPEPDKERERGELRRENRWRLRDQRRG